MRIYNILTTILLLMIGFNCYQTYQLQRTNHKIHKAAASMATQLKIMLTPPPAPESIATGIEAPAFSLINKENKEVSLATLSKEKKKILVFSSSTCQYCQDYYPELDKYTKENQEIEVIVIQAESTPEENEKLITNNNYSFDILVADQQVWQDYQIQATPTTIILDENNKIISSSISSTYADLTNLLGDS
ncbi:TlpA disulfide reductase family protein [uncultured Aquimarina sp.]|uniref:TlpA family protein disulfide reductase n=1 Tax=uncultured Aquimarina sp. TaxID=575652 RepID=UPI00262200BB|nr:TlpA disulfide reductase family protein [uncultured Aquimarina sp.]